MAWARLGKDSRAVPLLVGLHIFLGWIPFWLFVMFGPMLPRGSGLGQIYFDVFLLVVGLGLFAAMWRPMFASGATDREGYAVADAVQQYLGERLLILNGLLLRALAEIGQAGGEDQLWRQVVNQPLIEGRLWEKLEGPEKDLLALPQGTWATEQTWTAAEWSEQLRLLRWVLGIDEDLVGIGELPQLEGLLLPVGQAVPKTVRRPPWEIRLQRDAAEIYLARAWAELDARQLLEGEAVPEAVRNLLDGMAGPSTDMLVGHQTMGELPADDVRQLVALALARCNYASYLMECLDFTEIVSYAVWWERRELENRL
jgi:hypothetical protein